MRNRYLDLLRAAAIVRVIVYHLYGWPWLSILLPAMGVMFALAGSLTAASLEKRAAAKVVSSRLRRLLPPLWLLGLLAVPVMLVTGWASESDGEHPFSIPGLLFWLFPIGDPPGSDQALDAWEPLWYIRAYLWFVLLSPVLWLLYRKVGWVAVALPLAVMAVLDVTGFTLPDTADAALWDFVTYGACWVAGFAHHDGRLARVKPWIAGPVALAMAAGAYYFMRDEGTYDLNDISESQALWSLAFVLIVLRWQPSMGWLARVKPLDSTVTLINNRAVTIYLWHNIAIAAVWPVLTFLALDDLGDSMGHAGDLILAFLLTILAVLAFGWVEDLAAKRRPRLWPASSRKKPEPAEPAPAAGPEPVEPQPQGASRAARVSGTASAMANLGDAKRQQTAAAAMHRLPANWPPIPRTEPETAPIPRAEPETAPISRAGPETETAVQNPGLPIAGRRPGGGPEDKPVLPAGWGASQEARQSGPDDPTEWFKGGRARD
ncbi:acyltransferase family protein [Actinoplanes sp. NPDC049596]|uniref:acyltransferase family protein n=1 Tax=unclassified Actinoplanes TaxID=2626549 RepID=UPI00342AD259